MNTLLKLGKFNFERVRADHVTGFFAGIQPCTVAQFSEGDDARAVVTNLVNQNAREPTLQSVGMFSDLPLASRAFYIQFQLNK